MEFVEAKTRGWPDGLFDAPPVVQLGVLCTVAGFVLWQALVLLRRKRALLPVGL